MTHAIDLRSEYVMLSVSNSWSGGDGELDEIPAMGDPAHMIQIGGDRHVSTREGQQRLALCLPNTRYVLQP